MASFLYNFNMITSKVDIWPIQLDPFDNMLQTTLSMGIIVTHNRTSYHRSLPNIQVINLGDRDVELFVKPGNQWFQPAPLFF